MPKISLEATKKLDLDTFTLRDYQVCAVAETYAFFRQGKRRCLTFAPTGGGKSFMILQLVIDAVFKRNRRALVIVHRTTLLEQLAETLSLIDPGAVSLIAPGYKADYSKPIQLAMAQTLEKRELPPDIGLLIGDEAHETCYTTSWRQCLDLYSRGIWALSPCFVVGLTATPWRTKSKEGFCHLFDCVAKAPSPRKLINAGWLTKERLFAYNILDTSNVKLDEDGDFNLASLARACTEEYNKDVFLKWKDLDDTRKTIAFCTGVKQAENLLKHFTEGGYKAKLVTGKDSRGKRKKLFNSFKADEFQVLISIGTLTMGFDEPSIASVVLARPSRSIALILQMIGRGCRLFEGKEDFHVLDFGGCLQFIAKQQIKQAKKAYPSLPEKELDKYVDPLNVHHTPLCPVKRIKPKDNVDMKSCPSCGQEMLAIATTCPHCGYKYPAKEKPAPRQISFPSLIEFIPPNKLKALNWLRQQLLTKFLDSEPGLDAIYPQFVKKFGYIPPRDWFIGAVFGCENPDQTMPAYQHYLRYNSQCPTAMIDYYIDQEFGEKGREYIYAFGGKYTRPQKEIKEFKPKEVLELDKYPTTIEAYFAGINKAGTTAESTVIEYAYRQLSKEGK